MRNWFKETIKTISQYYQRSVPRTRIYRNFFGWFLDRRESQLLTKPELSGNAANKFGKQILMRTDEKAKNMLRHSETIHRHDLGHSVETRQLCSNDEIRALDLSPGQGPHGLEKILSVSDGASGQLHE